MRWHPGVWWESRKVEHALALPIKMDPTGSLPATAAPGTGPAHRTENRRLIWLNSFQSSTTNVLTRAAGTQHLFDETIERSPGDQQLQVERKGTCLLPFNRCQLTEESRSQTSSANSKVGR
eukprot:1157529-Pelagomonas_calceolata.AAC.1